MTLLERVQAAGAQVVLVDGQPRVQGRKLPPALLEELRAHKADVLAELAAAQPGNNRWGEVPPPDADWGGQMLERAEADQRKIMAYVLRQPRPVHAWVMGRAAEYHQKFGLAAEDCEWRAAADVVAWQRHCPASVAVLFVTTLPTTEEMDL